MLFDIGNEGSAGGRALGWSRGEELDVCYRHFVDLCGSGYGSRNGRSPGVARDSGTGVFHYGVIKHKYWVGT